jgi:hypothetical protein
VRLAAIALVTFCAVQPAAAFERTGDVVHAYRIEQHARSEASLADELSRVIDAAPADARFDLYRAFDQLAGTWSQVAFLQSLLDLASGVESPSTEAALRATLRAQADFVLWEIDQADQVIERVEANSGSFEHARIIAAIRSLLTEIAGTVRDLQADASP